MKAVSVLVAVLVLSLAVITWQGSLADNCTVVMQFQQGSVDYTVDGESQYPMDTAPVNCWDRLFLVIRYVTDSLPDTEIAWDDNERRVTISSNKGNTIDLWIGKHIASIDGIAVQVDPDNPEVVPFIENGRTLLPLRFVCENLGAEEEDDIVWDEQTRTVTINFETPCTKTGMPTEVYNKPEILRDKYGIAHVFSDTDQGAFYGLGYAMGEDRPIQTLKLYAEVRGKSYLFHSDEMRAHQSDIRFLNLQIWDSVNESFDSFPSEVKLFSQAFADGFNDALSNQDDIPDWAFEISPVDPLAMSKRLMIEISLNILAPELSELQQITGYSVNNEISIPNESNEWALTSEKTSTGYSYLQADPHGYFKFGSTNTIMEIQLKGETFNFLGGVQSGTMFTCFFGTNGHLAWSATANGPDVADLYELTLTKNNTHYMYNESERELDIRIIEVGNGKRVRSVWSHYGTVLFTDIKNKKAYSAKISNMNVNDTLSENLARIRAETIDEYKSACESLSYPTANFAVVSTDDDIFYYYNARCYRRKDASESRHKILDGSNSENEWGELILFHELPQELNPDGGWFQNCNVVPWFISPTTNISNDFPPELCVPATSQGLRGQLSSRLLSSKDDWDAESLKGLAFNTYCLYAEWFIPTLEGTLNKRYTHRESLDIVKGLSNWNYSYNQNFEFGKAFEIVAKTIIDSKLFKTNQPLPLWNELTSDQQDFLVNAVDSATEWLLGHYGSVRKPWGECSRLFVGDVSFPVGCPDYSLDTLHLAGGEVDDNGIMHIDQGSVFMMLFEMSDPVKAWSCCPLGLNEDVDSNGYFNASKRYSNNTFKPCYFTPEDVLASFEEDEEDTSKKQPSKTPAGGILITKIPVEGIGDIIVRCKIPDHPRYPEGAPICVSSSGFFVPFVGFHSCIDTTEIGCIKVDYLWPGYEDPRLDLASDGVFDHGGSDCIKAFGKVVAFACGQTPDVDGSYIYELIEVNPLTDNVGIYAFSHSGVAGTNVMALHSDEFPNLKWFVGRENPTIDEMYPLELGYYEDGREKKPVYNPFYHPEDYTPTTINVDYSTVDWIQNDTYPDGRPVFRMDDGNDHILSHKHPKMWGKSYYSRKLTHALLNNGVFSLSNWPDDLATPAETDSAWSFRTTTYNYTKLVDILSDLKTMLIFQSEDHVQAAPDKPHIHQAWDGFHHTADL